MIFEYFDKAYCINLKDKVDRKISATNQFKNIGLNDVTFINVTKPNNQGFFKSIGAYGCTLSHFKIYELANNENINNFIIFEDDVIFEADFINKINPIIEDLKKVDWDIFYFFQPKKGFNDLNGNRGNVIFRFPSGLVQTTGTILTHAYAINVRCLDKLIEKLNPNYIGEHNHIDIRIIDKAISNLDLNFYACSSDFTYQNKNI